MFFVLIELFFLLEWLNRRDILLKLNNSKSFIDLYAGLALHSSTASLFNLELYSVMSTSEMLVDKSEKWPYFLQDFVSNVHTETPGINYQ